MTDSVNVAIVGAGGHGREILDIILNNSQAGDVLKPVGFIDDDPIKKGKYIDGYQVISTIDEIERHVDGASISLVCGIGNPELNRKISERLSRLNYQFATVISNKSDISNNVTLGKGTIIFPSVTINTGCIIGNFVTVNVGTTVSHDSNIGDYCNINPGVHIAGNVTLGSECYIGMGTNIIQNITIGDRSTIGAGSVVIRDICGSSLAYGVPAKPVR